MATQSQPPASSAVWQWLKLGHMSGKRSADIVAGLRALTFPSPEAHGLSSFTGRLYARILMRLSSDAGIAHATGARQVCLTRLVEQVLAGREPPSVIVEMAAGFSGRALNLAQRFPQTKVVEIDLLSVVVAKQKRLRQLLGDRLPTNLYWLSADLGVTELPRLLGEQSIDIVISEGVLPYFTPAEITRIAASVRACLVPQGVFLTDILSSNGWKGVENKAGLAAWLLRRQVGRFKGAMSDSEGVRQLFERAGYADAGVHSLKALAGEYMPDREVADTSFLVAAYNSHASRV